MADIYFEMIRRRTANSKTYRLFDGGLQTEIFSGEIHYNDENGLFQNILTNLVDEADFDEYDFPVSADANAEFKALKEQVKAEKKAGKLKRDDYNYQTLRTPYYLQIGKNFRKGYTIGRGSDKLMFKPVNSSPAVGFIGDDKATIEFQDCWNDTDVKLQATDKGIKEYITLKTNKAPTTFTFEVGGALSEGLVSGEFQINPAWLEDANGIQRDVQQVLRVEGEIKYLDLIADVTGLAFPVVIDPTVSIQPDATAGKDSMIKLGQPDSNFDTDTIINAGNFSSDPSTPERSLLQFDVSTVPTGSYVRSASLYLRCVNETSTTNRNVYFHKITSSWDESTVTWNTMPAFNATADTSVLVTGEGVDFNISLTDFYSNVITNSASNYGHMLIGEESAGQSRKGFASSDYTTTPAYRPKLTIVYDESPSAPTVTAPNGGETWNATHTITWNAATDVAYEYAMVSAVEDASSGSFLSGYKVGQTFTTVENYPITHVEFEFHCTTQINATLKITGTSGGLPDEGNVLATKTVALPTSKSITKVQLDTPIQVAAGTVLAMFLENGSSYNGSYYCGGDTYSGGVRIIHNGSSWSSSSSYDLYFKVYCNEQKPQSELQYQIQVSTNNGVDYSNIVALTSAGANSYEYDFSGVAQTSQALIRIRAYDGYSYGPWDVSNGIFTIEHNQAPTAPTNLSPNGIAQDRTGTIRLSWQHNDPDNDPQSKFDLLWSSDGGENWTTVTESTTNQYKDFAADTFPVGTIVWKVRTYDQADVVSPYSSQASFTSSNPSATPVITAPTGTVAIARPNVTWSSVNQVSYQIQVVDSLAAVVWDTNEVVSTNKAVTMGYDLLNSSTYTVKVRIKDSDGIWSPYDSEVITTSFTEPPTPIITVTAEDGYINIAITNPAPTGSEPTLDRNDIYRREAGQTAWERIATGIASSGTYRDYNTASGISYDYKVRAWGNNGTYKDSATANKSLTLTGVWLHDVTDPAGTIQQFPYNESQNIKYKPNATLMQYAGRTKPVVEFGVIDEKQVSVSLKMLTQSSGMAALETLTEGKATVCFRDSRGRKVFGFIPELSPTDTWFGNTITLNVTEIDYTEVV